MIPARMSLATAFALLATHASAMTLKSSDVGENTYFPETEICARYGGADISPALAWSGAPATTKSFAVTMFDPDAHGGGWWHWLVVNIPPGTTALAQGAGSGKAALPEDALEAANSNGVNAYSGPCPPAGSGTHHYEITLWALDSAKAAIDADGDPQITGEWLQKHNIGMTRITPVYRK
jgi:Raf kinase inhibitor-like YbhB/YbcL family protein